VDHRLGLLPKLEMASRAKSFGILLAASFAIVLATAAFVSGKMLAAAAADQVSSAHRPAKGRSPAPAAEAEIAMPFRVGEKLEYRIAWSSFSDAANLELSVPERRDLFGWHTWHFQAAFHTVRPVRTLFAIDDQFDSYTDTASLECRQFEMYLNELGKPETDAFHLLPMGEKAHMANPSVAVLPGTRDPLGVLFTLRAVDWQRTPDLRVPVYDGRDLYQVQAHVEAQGDSVQVDAGSFKASRVAISVFLNGKETSGIHFTIWLANDSAHTPVQVAAQLPFGDLRVALTAIKAAGTGPSR
jgi:uncharacterized protein DUF3108